MSIFVNNENYLTFWHLRWECFLLGSISFKKCGGSPNVKWGDRVTNEITPLNKCTSCLTNKVITIFPPKKKCNYQKSVLIISSSSKKKKVFFSKKKKKKLLLSNNKFVIQTLHTLKTNYYLRPNLFVLYSILECLKILSCF